jgi:hypothetical protein
MKYPEVEETVRPFRLWDAVNKVNLAHRYYVHDRNAHLGALIEARWAQVGTTIEVYNCLTGRMLGQYTRRIHSIDFLR